MKVFSITFQSVLHPDKFGMYVAIANSIDEAYQQGLMRLNMEQGDLGWRPIMQSFITVDGVNIPQKVVDDNGSILTQQMSKLAETKSWLMQTIIENKDDNLLSAAERYLSEPEILYIKEKTCKQ